MNTRALSLTCLLSTSLLSACGDETTTFDDGLERATGALQGVQTNDTFAATAYLQKIGTLGPRNGVFVSNRWILSGVGAWQFGDSTAVLPDGSRQTANLIQHDSGVDDSFLRLSQPVVVNGTTAFKQIIATSVPSAGAILHCYDGYLKRVDVRVGARHGNTVEFGFAELGQAASETDNGDPCYSTVNIFGTTIHVLTAIISDVPWQLTTISPSVAPGLRRWVYGAAIANLESDAQTSIAVFRPSTGTWFVQPRAGGSAGTTVQFGQSGDVPVPADYDGDFLTDLAVFRPSNATWYLRTGVTKQWGQAGDVSVPADYDGDGKTDIAIWRPSTGNWHINQSSNGQTVIKQWGQAGDTPVPGRWDGKDMKADVAVWRKSNGTWFILDSSTGAGRAIQWGSLGDLPLPGDYYALGFLSPAIRHGADVYVASPDGRPPAIITVGGANDVGVAGDFDGDGVTDAGAYDSAGNWRIFKSSTSTITTTNWGVPGDIPIPKGRVL